MLALPVSTRLYLSDGFSALASATSASALNRCWLHAAGVCAAAAVWLCIRPLVECGWRHSGFSSSAALAREMRAAPFSSSVMRRCGAATDGRPQGYQQSVRWCTHSGCTVAASEQLVTACTSARWRQHWNTDEVYLDANVADALRLARANTCCRCCEQCVTSSSNAVCADHCDCTCACS